MRKSSKNASAEGLTTKVLNERLNKLTSLGIIDRESFPEVPPRVEYQLTAFGHDFVAILDQVSELQERYSKVTQTLGDATPPASVDE